MKKNKLWIPMLSIAGTACAVAPMVCLTSCNNKIDFTYEGAEGQVKNLEENSTNEHWIVNGYFDGSYNDIDTANSAVEVTCKSAGATEYFKDLIDTGDIVIQKYDTNRFSIKLLKTFPDKYKMEGKTVKSIKISIVAKITA